MTKGAPALALLWIISGVFLVLLLGNPPVERTQEARVLETAREMKDQPLRGWLIPTLNGQMRLQKPPLTYWMSAAAFRIGGVSEFTGRLPTALIGWFTIAVTFWIARWLFDDVTALISAAILTSSYAFFRFTRLAETDAPAMAGVTLAIGAFARVLYSSGAAQARGIFSRAADIGWFYLAALGIFIAALSKGPPAIFPVMFLVAAVIATKQYRALVRFIVCGAGPVALILSLAWFAYIIHTIGLKTFRSELSVAVEGEDHGGSALLYIPYLAIATLPWTPVLIIALIQAIRRWREENVKLVLIWFAAILLPLCIAGNKQPHYLMPLMPACAVLMGWGVSHMLKRAVLYEPKIIAAAASVTVLMLIGIGWWYPSTRNNNPRSIARKIQAKFGDGPYVFFGPEQSLPLCFAMRREIPRIGKAEELARKRASGLVVICKTRKDIPALLDGFEHEMHITTEEHNFEVYRAK